MECAGPIAAFARRPRVISPAPVLLLLAAALAGCGRPAGPAPVAALTASSAREAPPASAAPPAPEAPNAGALASLADAGALASLADAGADASLADAGADAGPAPSTDCPGGMARVGRICIDRWEAHLAVRSPAGELSKLPFFARPPEDGAYQACSEAGAFPQAYVSRVEAQIACRNAGKRLCSRSEWQRACQGRGDSTYPYGAHWQAKRCNMDKAHLLASRFGADARRWRYEDFNDPSLNQTPGFLAAAGAYDTCVGDAGVYDLVGNLHEWVSDTVDQELMDALAAEEVERNDQPWRLGNGVFMGGFFSTHEQLGPGCKYITVAHEPTYHDYSTGFRCCSTAPTAKEPRPPTRKKK